LLSRRTDAKSIAALVGAVLGLDLLWSFVEGSTGSLAYGLLDEPAHLATCAIALFAVAAVTGSRPPARFVVAALVASVAIDVDHIPGYLGWQGLAGSLPRPYPHSLLLVGALVGLGCASRRRDVRQVSLGLAFGVSAHLLRDLATGPGVPLVWPVSSGVATVPYAFFAGALALAALAVAAPRRAPLAARAGSTAAMVGLALSSAAVLAIGLLPAPARAMPSKISLGAYIPGGARDPSLIDAYSSAVGQNPVIVSTYVQWPQRMFGRGELESIWNRGAVPLVTWEPWTSSEKGFSLRAIARGRYDGYIRHSARAAVAWGKPILLRFAHEMNGNWYPWGTRHGNTARLYKETWRHVVGIFRRVGADNVKWVWSPYVSNGGRFVFKKYFPGNRWIDWVGLDGFNWARHGVWQSFKDIFADSYHTVSRMTSRPIMIPETGSSQVGGDKAAWVSRVLDRELPRFARIRALVWFSERFNGIDARVDSSPSALNALRDAITAGRYRSNRSHLLATPSHLRF